MSILKRQKFKYTNKVFYLVFIIQILLLNSVNSQKNIEEASWTTSDTIRGGLRIERTCFDHTYSDLSIRLLPETKSIQGVNTLFFKVQCPSERIQVDLFRNMQVDSIKYINETIAFERIEDALFIESPTQEVGKTFYLSIYYHGVPRIAKNPPWDGGFIWEKDNEGNPWYSVSCQGIGASLWRPCMDYQGDEVDSFKMSIIAPKDLKIIANGNLEDIIYLDQEHITTWKVHYPINSYNVSFSAGNYVHFSDTFSGPYSKNLPLDYYVLAYNEDIARKHFKQVHDVLEAFEHYFGPYPYFKDGFALIETPFLGMEHQSGIAYGNQFTNGYLGRKRLKNMDWDYIIVHETGHEWWGNKVTSSDIGDIWIHEGFTTYSEALYVEYHYGYDTMIEYLKTQRRHRNKLPLMGPKGVHYNQWSDTDHYYKGSWVLHTLRHTIDNDTLFFDILKSFQNLKENGIVCTEDFIALVEKKVGKSFQSFFQQYLEVPSIPTLEYQVKQEPYNTFIEYKWDTKINTFDMPIWVTIDDKPYKLSPKTNRVSQFKLNHKTRDIKWSTEKQLYKLRQKKFNNK